MSIKDVAIEYKEVSAEIKRLEAEKNKLKNILINATSPEGNEKRSVTIEGVTITSFCTAVTALPWDVFKCIPLDRIYKIANFVQNRMTTEEKAQLEVVDYNSRQVRVSGV